MHKMSGTISITRFIHVHVGLVHAKLAWCAGWLASLLPPFNNLLAEERNFWMLFSFIIIFSRVKLFRECSVKYFEEKEKRSSDLSCKLDGLAMEFTAF